LIQEEGSAMTALKPLEPAVFPTLGANMARAIDPTTSKDSSPAFTPGHEVSPEAAKSGHPLQVTGADTCSQTDGAF
jgi:hypothetical protein